MDGDALSNGCSSTEGCSRKLVSSIWMGKGVCHLNAVCTTLSGNTCADYVVETTNQNQGTQVDKCNLIRVPICTMLFINNVSN